MEGKAKRIFFASKEGIFQVILHLLVFIFYSFDREKPQIQISQVTFFLNYAIATFIISYILLPQFYYRKKYLQFFVSLVVMVATVIMIEEFILEQIYFPDTRGKKFNAVFYTLIDVLPVIAILSGFKFAWDALRKQKEVDELKAAVERSEMQFLKSQINPHFLFNNLNNLYAFAIENSPQTPTIILELSEVLRYMLYECKEKFVPLTKEVKQLKNFTELYKLQIEERGIVNFTQENIQSNYQIAPLILIVFIENAFKHSQASQSDKIYINISIQLSDQGQLNFSCMNNYQETTNTENLAHGIGLENVKKRLQLLYPYAHQLNIRQTKNQFKVQLSLQLEKQI